MLAMKQVVSISFERENVICEPAEAAVQRCSEISQNSQENTCEVSKNIFFYRIPLVAASEPGAT